MLAVYCEKVGEMPLRIYLTNRVLVEESGTVLLDERRLMGRQGRLAFAFLMGEEGPWVTSKRSELRDVLVRAHECLSEPGIWGTEPAYAVKHANEAVTIEPFRETSYQLLMRAHAAVGNRAEALRVYERCRSLLSEELGVPPSPQTEAVYLEILRS